VSRKEFTDGGASYDFGKTGSNMVWSMCNHCECKILKTFLATHTIIYVVLDT